MKAKSWDYNTKRGVVILLATMLVALFWSTAITNNIYKHVLVGVIYEILWLPMMLMIILIPLFSILFWRKEQWSFKTTYPYCIIIHSLTVIFLFFYS
jgi:hypothetical protein